VDLVLKSHRLYALSSGMMTEHTISNIFARRLLTQPEHAILFVGYCDPASPGGVLRHASPGDLVQLDADAAALPLRCRTEKFNFSAHSSREDLRAFANRLRPKKILLVHGDAEASAWFRETLAADLPESEVLIPPPGETIAL
jgi:Cft2 family RNA processing exonuclease